MSYLFGDGQLSHAQVLPVRAVKNTKKIMCYHYGLAKPAENIQKRFKLKDVQSFEQPFFHANAFDKGMLPVISGDDPATLVMMRWGLIPHWSDTDQLRYATQNAMVETAAEKPAFRQAFESGRCIIPMDGFYEWQHLGKQKQPWFIYPKEMEIAAFAGIYDRWQDSLTGKWIQSFSILTMPANPLMANIHNTKKRMPVVLPFDLERVWLDAERPSADLNHLWRAAAEVSLSAYPVRADILKLPDGPAKREALAASEGGQLRWF